MQTLTIHVGTHKTGSTSLQAFCFNNKQRLQGLGYYYPTSGSYFGKNSGHSWLAYALAGRRPVWLPPEAAVPEPTACVQEIRDHIAASRADHVLISSEHFFIRLSPQQLYQTFEGLGYQLKVIVFLRPQDEFLESRYAQLVWRGSLGALSFEDFVDQELADPNGYCYYHQRLERLADVFGKDNIAVRTFSTHYTRERLFADFLEVVGLELHKSFELPSIQNVALPSELILTLVALQEHLEGDEAQRLDLNKRVIKGHQALGISNTNTRFFSPKRARAVMDHFSEDNAHVASTFLDRQYLFEPDEQTGWRVATPPSREKLVDTFLALWSSIHDEQLATHDECRKLKQKVISLETAINHD